MNQLAQPPRAATYQDILNAPEGMVAEIIGGALHLQPRPASPHVRAAGRIHTLTDDAFDLARTGPGGWWVLPEPELHFTPDVLVPDIAGWRRQSMSELEAVPHFKTAPDWVCEVLSPRTREYDLTEKRAIYGRHGVGHLWFVDPLARTFETFVNEGGVWRLGPVAHGEMEVAAAPFEAMTLWLGDLWLPGATEG